MMMTDADEKKLTDFCIRNFPEAVCIYSRRSPDAIQHRLSLPGANGLIVVRATRYLAGLEFSISGYHAE